MTTTMTPKFERSSHRIDANNVILGKLAVDIANRLRGKDKPYFVAHLDVGDYVTIINPDKFVVSGDKLNQKVYRRHSGYIGGMTEILLKDRMHKPEEVIRDAVLGMLPKNRLRNDWIKRLTFEKTSQVSTTKETK